MRQGYPLIEVIIRLSILPKKSIKAQRIVADILVMKPKHVCFPFSLLFFRYLLVVMMSLLWPTLAVATSVASITYATRIDAVSWEFSGSKFSCQLTHPIDNFGAAVFERKAGESTQFVLQSNNPRMKSGQAVLVSQPPFWLNAQPTIQLSMVDVKHGVTPVQIPRKMSERMLAELQKGRDLQFVRQPWYGDDQALVVVIPSVGFRKTHSDYLQCLGGLLPVNFSQVEKKSLYYQNEDEDLRRDVKRYLDRLIAYVKEDPSVLSIYIDGHTDSQGVRNENLLKSQRRAERILDYLLEQGLEQEKIVTRWHGERYQVASNQSASGRAKNRRVTVRLSKEPPRQPSIAALAQASQVDGNNTNNVSVPASQAPNKGNGAKSNASGSRKNSKQSQPKLSRNAANKKTSKNTGETVADDKETKK